MLSDAEGRGDLAIDRKATRYIADVFNSTVKNVGFSGISGKVYFANGISLTIAGVPA